MAEQQQQEIDNLRSQLNADKARLAELEKIEEFWRHNFGISPPTTIHQVKAVQTDLLRGFPTCDQNDNVLVEATLQNGETELHIRPPITSLEDWAHSTGIQLPSPGNVLKGDSAAESLLATLYRFYAYRNNASKPCRFDYRLRWTTDTDYRIGRDKLEHYLYPAGIVRSTGNLR